VDPAPFRAAEARLWASTRSRPTERRLDLRRNQVSVRVQELGEGPPVLFVHGANTSGASWATLASRLDGFRRIVLDRPGTGLSDPLPRKVDAATVRGYGETLLIDVLDALDLPTAHVVATSFGGFVALQTAAAHPDRVGRMVQFSWPAGAPAVHVPATMRLMTFPLVGRLLTSVPSTEWSVRMTFRGIGHGPSLDDGRITVQDLATYLALLRSTDTLRNERAMGRALLSPRAGSRGFSLPDEVLAAIRTPTHFIWGERDPFGGPDIARQVVARIPNATLEIVPGAGHAPWLDALDRCATATMAALSG
jgi:pimeloyl-ACP methyl ester carboxylesterase